MLVQKKKLIVEQVCLKLFEEGPWLSGKPHWMYLGFSSPVKKIRWIDAVNRWIDGKISGVFFVLFFASGFCGGHNYWYSRLPESLIGVQVFKFDVFSQNFEIVCVCSCLWWIFQGDCRGTFYQITPQLQQSWCCLSIKELPRFQWIVPRGPIQWTPEQDTLPVLHCFLGGKESSFLWGKEQLNTQEQATSGPKPFSRNRTNKPNGTNIRPKNHRRGIDQCGKPKTSNVKP